MTDKRAWQRMLSGRRLDILSPSPVDIEITDIVHGLCRVARWNGQTSGKYAYSVAQHSLLVENIMRDLYPNIEYKYLLMCLLHDGSEYVIGDMISPFKNAIGANFRDVEGRLQEAIHTRFSLPAKTPPKIKKIIKECDLFSANIEAIELAGFSKAEASKIIAPPLKTDKVYSVEPLSPEKVYAQFMKRFEFLLSKL